jgi:hypothetical protein
MNDNRGKRQSVKDTPSLTFRRADWTENDTAIDRLAVQVIACAVRDAIHGDQEAREWIISEDAEIWLQGAGYGLDTLRQGIARIIEHPEAITLPEPRRGRRRSCYNRPLQFA